MSDYIDEHPKEESIYKEIIGRYHAVPENTHTTYDKQVWESFNNLMNQLVSMGHQDYSRFKVTIRKTGTGVEYVNYPTLKSEMMGSLQKMSQEFRFTDPLHLLYRDAPKSGVTYENTLTNTQSQNQKQELTVNIETGINNAIEQIRQTVGEKAAVEAKKQLDELKKGGSWENIQKTLGWVINAGRDTAIAVLPVLVDFYLKRGMG